MGKYCSKSIRPQPKPYEYHEETNLYKIYWNWLMDVVDKIEDMGCEIVITNGECTISGSNDYYEETISKSRRDATYKAVVEFINEYNRTNDER